MKDWINKLLMIIIFMTILNGSIYVMSNVIVDRTVDQVLEIIEKEYSPSPYGSGFDPDKFDLNRSR